MKIYIPTSGRPDHQPTADALAAAGIKFMLVGGIDDFHTDHACILDDGSNGIRAKRQWILDTHRREFPKEPLIMMDDDLRFRVRKDGKFQAAGPKDLKAMVTAFQTAFTARKAVHVGISDEFMCQHNPTEPRRRGRYNQVLGYLPTRFPKSSPTFRLEVNEEHDFSLQLQAAGHAPYILTDYTKGSKAYAKGGCSVWRTPEVELEAHHELARLWPDLVHIVPHKNSISGFAIRVAWAKALKENRT